jgi:hypothetical protein
MKKSKKSAAGHAEVWKLFDGEKDKINKDLSVKTARFYLHATIQTNVLKIGLFGLRNGF